MNSWIEIGSKWDSIGGGMGKKMNSTNCQDFTAIIPTPSHQTCFHYLAPKNSMHKGSNISVCLGR